MIGIFETEIKIIADLFSVNNLIYCSAFYFNNTIHILINVKHRSH